MGQTVEQKRLSPMQQQIFLTCANLLAGKEEGTAQGLAFFPGKGPNDPADGLALWEQAVKIKNFPVNREAKLVRNPDVVQEFTTALLQDLEEHNIKRKISFVEIGPGLWESVHMKTVPYIDALLAHEKDGEAPITQYIALDPSKECAQAAAEGIKELYGPGIRSRSMVNHFEDVAPLRSASTPVAVLWGPTIWNSGIGPKEDPELVLASKIKSVKQFVKPGGYVLSTYYSSEGKDVDETAYNDPRNLQLVHSLAHRFEQEISDTNFKADTFEPYVEYVGNGIGRFCMGIKSKKRQTVTLNGSVERDFKKGDGIVLTNSWRLTEAKLYKMVSAADAEMIKHTYDKKTGAGMFLARF